MNLNYFVVSEKTEDLCISVLRNAKDSELREFLDHVPEKFKTESFYLEVLRKNTEFYSYIDQTKLSHNFKFKAVSINGHVLSKIPSEEHTFELVKEAVNENSLALKYTSVVLTEELYLQIIKKNVWVIKHIFPQTENLCLKALKINGATLEYIKNPTPEMCLVALKSSDLAYEFVKFVPNPDHSTTLNNIKKFIEVEKNKKIVKSTIIGIKNES